MLWMKADAMSAVDSRLEVVGDRVFEVLGGLKLGLMCTSRNPKHRPSMADVVHLLESLGWFATINQLEQGNKSVPLVAQSFQQSTASTGSYNGISMTRQHFKIVDGRD